MMANVPLKRSGIYLILLIIGLGCSMWSSKPKSGKEKVYSIEGELANFKAAPHAEADYAFEDSQGSFVVAYSICERFEPGTLKRKAGRLINAFPERKIITSRKTKLGQHSAYEMKAEVSKDQKKFKIELLVSEINHCAIDFYYLSQVAHYKADVFPKFLEIVKVLK